MVPSDILKISTKAKDVLHIGIQLSDQSFSYREKTRSISSCIDIPLPSSRLLFLGVEKSFDFQNNFGIGIHTMESNHVTNPGRCGGIITDDHGLPVIGVSRSGEQNRIVMTAAFRINVDNPL